MNELTEIAEAAELTPRQKILALEAEIAKLPSIERFVSVVELHAPGQYVRVFRLAAHPWGDERQSIVTGKIHRHAHLNVILKGRCTVYTENGLEELQAPAYFIGTPGVKRVCLIHEDLEWMTVHNNPTNETDISMLEAEIIAPSYLALEGS